MADTMIGSWNNFAQSEKELLEVIIVLDFSYLLATKRKNKLHSSRFMGV